MCLCLCACSRATYRVSQLADAGSGLDAAASAPGFPVTGIGSSDLRVTGVDPESGPFSGGNTAIVRGSGFDKNAIVRIGGTMVQPASITLTGTGRLSVVVPPGKVGLAEVSVTDAGHTAKLAKAYQYNALAFDPARGSSAGGTFVEITLSGTAFPTGGSLELDGLPCTKLQVLTPYRVRCRTPAHAAGVVDALVRFPKSLTKTISAKAAFEYVDTADDNRGGLSGDPIHGTLNVSVIDSGGGFVLPGAYVLLGNDPKGKYQGLTDKSGKITFSGADITAPVTVHAALKCFERSSIVSFDAENVTLFLSPILDFSCADKGKPDAGGHGQLGSTVSGQLIFPGADEFGVNPWDIVPKPKAGEARVAYVFTTQASLAAGNPPPDVSGGMARLEEQSALHGDRGYLYSIFARPAGLAVYALAGLERSDTGRFTPYAMGVARDLVTSPGDDTKNVDLQMTITLDRELAVSLGGLPAAVSGTPNQYRVQSYVDLGGEGVIVRKVAGVNLDLISRYTADGVFRFIGQPAFVNALQDASYGLVAGFYTEGQDMPYTEQTRIGVKQTSDAFALAGFLGIPQLVAPAAGARIPSDRMLRFEIAGPTPDLLRIEITGGDGNPAWNLVLPGDARAAPIPDLAKTVGDVAAGELSWTVTSIRLDSFVYNQFHYADLTPRRFTHSAGNQFTMQQP